MEWGWVAAVWKLTTDPIKGEGRYMYGELETWQECIKTNFYRQDVLQNMYCIATALLNIEPVYKVKTTIPSYLAWIANTVMQKASNAACWVIQMVIKDWGGMSRCVPCLRKQIFYILFRDCKKNEWAHCCRNFYKNQRS